MDYVQDEKSTPSLSSTLLVRLTLAVMIVNKSWLSWDRYRLRDNQRPRLKCSMRLSVGYVRYQSVPAYQRQGWFVGTDVVTEYAVEGNPHNDQGEVALLRDRQ